MGSETVVGEKAPVMARQTRLAWLAYWLADYRPTALLAWLRAVDGRGARGARGDAGCSVVSWRRAARQDTTRHNTTRPTGAQSVVVLKKRLRRELEMQWIPSRRHNAGWRACCSRHQDDVGDDERDEFGGLYEYLARK